MKKTNVCVVYPTTADRHYGRLLYDAMRYKLAWLGHRALFYSQGKVGVTAGTSKTIASANVPVNESELDFGLLHNDLALWMVLQKKKFNNLQENRSQLE